MKPERIIIDCDPGHDDAVAILMALGAPDAFDVIGVTTVSGNAAVALTEDNARRICALAGRPDVPVFGGCSRPMVRGPYDATEFHGKSGLDGLPTRVALDRPLSVRRIHAIDFLIERLTGSEDPVTLVCLAPLTNIAMALVKAPAIKEKIKEIVFMGGARRTGGNVSPCATFNVLCDPHAAHVVVESGCPLTVVSLDATSKVVVSDRVLEDMALLRSDVARATHQMLTFFNRRRVEAYGYTPDQATLNDPCVIAYLLDRTLFSGKRTNIAISLDSGLTLGMTVVDLSGRSGRAPNAMWIDDANGDGVCQLLLDVLARYEIAEP